jgi:hypothetical protein
MATTNKIKIQIGDEVTELTGAEKEAFVADRAQMESEALLLEAKEAERKEARESAIKKLAEIAGLTKEELASIL